MAKPFKQWTVLPHDALILLGESILTVTGRLHMPPMGEVNRRMTVVKLRGGRLVIFSAICLEEVQMARLEAFGVPAYLIVPNDIHRMDARVWKDRYPSLRVVTPAAGRAKVEEVVSVDATDVDFDDPTVSFLTVPGTGEREAALMVREAEGTTLVLNDLIFDLANRAGLTGWLFKAIGMTGDRPHIPPPVRLRQVKDAPALKRQLESWSRVPDLTRVVISHGDIVTRDAAGVLARVAADLRG